MAAVGSNTVAGMSVALVTGASTGIGKATAVRLAREPGAELVLVARREELLRALAESLPCKATYLTVDLTDADAPERVRAHLEAEHGRLDLLVNNAGGAWRGAFAEAGYANVHRHMQLNFDAVVRLTEALLPLLRASAPSAIVNVASTAGRVARARTGAYSASKFALIGWTDSLYAEEKPHGVHVGMVLPGFVRTEGFPATELREKALTRWIVSKPEKVAEAIYQAGPGGKAERYVPRPYAIFAVLRILTPSLVRRVLTGGAAASLTTSTAGDKTTDSAAP
jgi:short-subunit dehydrogenase